MPRRDSDRNKENTEQPPPEPPVPDDFDLTENELKAGESYNMSRVELIEACRVFRERLDTCSELEQCPSKWALSFEDVDLLLRQLRIFMSMRTLWALLLEIDENVNGKVEVDEFIGMVAKLRGRSPMSPDFHLRSLPRSVRESYTDLFERVVGSESGLMEKDDFVASSKKLNPHVNVNSEQFRQSVEDLGGAEHKYGIHDFLVFQAKLRKQPPEIDVAILSLTEEELENFTALFREWRSKSQINASAAELRIVLQQVGFTLSAEQCRNRMAPLDLDGSRAIQLNEFLYILVNLGLGTCGEKRTVLLPGATYEEAFNMGIGLQELWELGYDNLRDIKTAGWSIHHVSSAGYWEPWEMKQVGFTAGDVRKAGFSATQLKLAGFSLEELRNAGFSYASLQECGSILGKHRAQKVSDGPGLELRPTTPADKSQGMHGEQRWWGTPRIQAMLQPDQNDESIMSIMSH